MARRRAGRRSARACAAPRPRPRPGRCRRGRSGRSSACRSDSRPCVSSLPSNITPDVAAHLVDLAEQVARDEDGGALGGELADEVPHLAGALRVEAVGRLVEHQQVARHEQRVGDREPLAHAERVRAVALGRRGQQPDAVERGVDPRAAPYGRRCAGRRRRGGRGWRGRRGRVERRSLDQRADPAQRPGGAGRAWVRRGPRCSPTSAAIRPSSIRMVVVLPDPFGPRKP